MEKNRFIIIILYCNAIFLSRFRVVSFDATGTLFGVRGSVGHHYVGIIDNDALNRNFLKCFSELSKKSPIFGRDIGEAVENQTGQEWWSQLVKMVMIRSAGDQQSVIDAINKLPVQFYHDLYHKFEGDRQTLLEGRAHECWQLFPEVLQTLDQLKYKDKKIVSIISNFDERIYSILKHLGISNYFKDEHTNLITTSFDCGYSKPNKLIFEDSYKKIQAIDSTIRKDQILYIGDHLEKDLKGAAEFGFKSLLIDRNNQHPDITTNKIAKLNDIFNI
ncbi:hypothetical protein PPL_03159 [Heterostelium album PN500]|uniref:Uncharacterized protein n=1 Tax=Heterostelium pallidum (strain ATCC 26659 / Pp 5 / PN500) TaxID=670386 RepID=D3B438_HETP5|nr:hypothetical protein PPL_03159 [Heterostelium album PN500]EFA84086.1 hypothetical protein PPL_03159 [Heterostelium album PN500]|eukprot:XP_020436203.1 hypothetical protein PPL_03159 [Heterostelium album PN500]